MLEQHTMSSWNVSPNFTLNVAVGVLGKIVLSFSTSESQLSQHSSPPVLPFNWFDMNARLTLRTFPSVHVTHSVSAQSFFKESGSGTLLRKVLMKSLRIGWPSSPRRLSSPLFQSSDPLHATMNRNLEHSCAFRMVSAALSPFLMPKLHLKSSLEIVCQMHFQTDTATVLGRKSALVWSAYVMESHCNLRKYKHIKVVHVFIRATFNTTLWSGSLIVSLEWFVSIPGPSAVISSTCLGWLLPGGCVWQNLTTPLKGPVHSLDHFWVAGSISQEC